MVGQAIKQGLALLGSLGLVGGVCGNRVVGRVAGAYDDDNALVQGRVVPVTS